MTKTTTMLTVAGIAVGGLVAYAVYFDYKRRTDANFRKQLRKDKKRVAKSQASSEASASSNGVDVNELKHALETVKQEEVPTTPEEKEKYFMAQVGMGEQLCAKGPTFNLPAALCFYRALRVYPSPVELIVIYERTVPPPVFQVRFSIISVGVKERVEGYYDCFPPKVMNVAVKTIEVPVKGQPNTSTRKKTLVCTKDFEAGELIYKEEAIERTATTAYAVLIPSSVVRPESDRLDSAYCSTECLDKAKTHSQSLLFSLDSPLPAPLAPTILPAARAARDEAQQAFADYLKKREKAAPQLVARFIARQVSAETAKMIPGSAKGAEPTTRCMTTSNGLRYLDLTPPEEETKILREFVTEERHATYLGGMSYNAFGVYFGEGRDDKPEPAERPEDVEKSRTPKQVGAGFYAVSSYCIPSARPSFDKGTAELHLIANRPLKAGDELTVAYVDVTQKEGESVDEARRRRRIELVRGWRFACTCERCAQESNGSDEEPAKDESKVSDVVKRAEGV
ncbi:hypothetical protein BKA83DRAFT_672528 [Pisolithus microcarpus]|nr:hypothetical protein BKA83DRAFT_672528 [Pisolithus microcarpus]